MSPQEQSDLLIRMDQKLTDLGDEFRRVSNGQGFPRCVERNSRLVILEKQIARVRNHLTWVWRSLALAGVGIVVKLIMA